MADLEDAYTALDSLANSRYEEDAYDYILDVVRTVLEYGRSQFQIEPGSILDELDL